MATDKPPSRVSTRSRKRTDRTEQHDQEVQEKHERERKLQAKREIAAEVASESQLVEENDNFMYASAGEFVDPALATDAAKDPQQYEADRALFLLRRAEAYGGDSRQLRVAWADKSNPMTLAELEDTVRKLTAEIPSLPVSGDKGKGKATDIGEDGPGPYPEIAFGQPAAIDPEAASQGRSQVDPRFSGASASSAPAPKRIAPGGSQGSASKKQRSHAYLEPLFPDNAGVPQVAAASQRQSAINRAHSPGRALSESGGSTRVNGKTVLYPQNLDPNAIITVPATCEPAPDMPPKQGRHVKPSNTKSAGSRPHAKNPPRPTTGLKIASALPARAAGSGSAAVHEPLPVTSKGRDTSKAASASSQKRATSTQQPRQGERVADARQGPVVALPRSAERPASQSRPAKPASNLQAPPIDRMPVAGRGPSGADRQHDPRGAPKATIAGQGSIVANARSDSHAGHTIINRARVSANATGYQPQPAEQRVAPVVAEPGRRGTGNARARGPAAVVPPVNAPGRAEAPVQPVEPNVPAAPRAPTPDDIEGEMDYLDEEDADAPRPTDLMGSPTNPHHVIFFAGKLNLRSFARMAHPTVRLFQARFKAKSLAQGTYEWHDGKAGPWVPSNEDIAVRAWAFATRRLNNRLPFLLEHLKYGESLVTTARSNIKHELESLIIEYWHFSEDQPDSNRRLAEDLLPNGFHKRDDDDGTVPFGSAFMLKACHRAIFNGPSSIGVRYPNYFNPIPWRFLAFIATLCYQIIYCWLDGDYKKEPLDVAQQQPIFRMFMKLIEKANHFQKRTLAKTCGVIHDSGRAKYVSAPARAPSPVSPTQWASDIQEPYVSNYPIAAPEDNGDGELGQDDPDHQSEVHDEDERAPLPPRRARADQVRADRIRAPAAPRRNQRMSEAPKRSPAPSSRASEPIVPRHLTPHANGGLVRYSNREPNVAGPSGLHRLEGRDEGFGVAGPSHRAATRDESEDLPSPQDIRVAAELGDVPEERLQGVDDMQEDARGNDGMYEDEDMRDAAGMDLVETLKDSPDDAEAAEYDDEQDRNADDMLD